jgi:hypothetical protein
MSPTPKSLSFPIRKRERLTVNVPPELVEWARRAVVLTPGLTLTGLVEVALTLELERLERKLGKPFPPTKLSPRRGRPVSLQE